MGTEEKRRKNTPSLDAQVKRSLIGSFVAILLAAVIIYVIGALLRIWNWPGPSTSGCLGQFISMLIALVVYAIYQRVMLRRLLEHHFVGMKHLKNGENIQALEAFKQLYDLYNQNPELEKLHARRLLRGTASFRPRELALTNMAAVYARLGNGPEAIRCYEECVILNPQNGTALMSLNLAAAVSGGELHPPPPRISPLTPVRWTWLAQPTWQGSLSILTLLLAGICCGMPFVRLIQEESVHNRNAMLIVAIMLPVTIIAIISMLQLVNQFLTRRILKDYYQGTKLYSQDRYYEGIQAFQKQVDLFEKRPWLNNRRRLFKRTNHVSYLEWSLLWMAYGYIQLGEGDQLLPIYERVLELNPDNDVAQTNIRFINLFRTEEGLV